MTLVAIEWEGWRRGLESPFWLVSQKSCYVPIRRNEISACKMWKRVRNQLLRRWKTKKPERKRKEAQLDLTVMDIS